MRDHTKLRAFELADEVVILIYRATRKFPREEIQKDGRVRRWGWIESEKKGSLLTILLK